MQLSPRRVYVGTGIAFALAAIVAWVVASRASVRVNARKQAAVAEAQLHTMLADARPESRAIALAYLERARLGLGSPYRLIELAVRDPRLPDSVAQNVAWTIVGRLFAGDVYEIDPRALDLVSQPGSGKSHLGIIEDVIRGADDPRVGEAAVRVAYALAASNGATSLTSLPIVAEAAAQVRDRVLAQRDLRSAVPRAQRDGVGLIDELIHLRITRELAVEAPLLGALSPRDREASIDAAREILRRIEAVSPEVDTARGSPSLVDRKSAMTLAKLAMRLPPLAAVRVPVTGRMGTLRADSLLARSALAVVGSAANEESLIAAYAYADHDSDGRSGSLRRLMVSAGVALRAHSQERVWFPGQSSTTPSAVVGRFGLGKITFERGVPRDWWTFYSQMIASALEDFERAVPGYDPAGLSFHVSMGALPDSALAMHDPRTHTIRLSAMTPTGTLAHELAHDLDWRAARRLFAKSGGYATDRSLREQSPRLAGSVRGLTSARVAGRGRISPTGSGRPAEVFARSVDWFVTDALAAMGRSNGYLSAIEDPLLAGFAAMPADAATLDAAHALVGLLGQMTFLPDSASADYLRRWSTFAALEPSTIVLRTMDAPILARRAPRVPPGLTRDMVTDLATGMLCRVDAMRDGDAQDRLLTMAIDARARGIARRRARYAPTGARVEEDSRMTTARVAEGFARAGLLELPPAPFQPRCD
jgi:hypothetical protein